PLGTNGETLTTQRAVGAHQKHVVTGTIRNAFACSDCHAPVTDLTHVNGTISLPFTGLASQGTTPSWTGTTCASTYCHGATLAAGGSTTTPTWTAVSAGPTACSSCHGAPPPFPHPPSTDCARCHSGTVLATGAIDLAGGKHIDGTLQVDGGGCTACHGTEGVNPAPPVGTRGETLTTQRAVGAHQKHVVTGTIRNAFACSDCHAPVTDLTHVNGTISLPFAGLASNGTTPDWNGATCASTYCHGATLGAGGLATAPTWTVVSAGPTACSSCHGAPPPLPHPQNADCNRCHEGTVLATGAIDLAGGKHIDGTVQVDGGGCTACHGTEGVNPAPPVGTRGETLTTQRAVGAHQKHVVTGTIRNAFTCSDCHAPVSDLTHVNGTISLPFDGLASNGTTPSWTGTTCSSTYCHGATLAAGGSNTAPTWTAVSAGPTACTACHGAPPPFPHPPSTDCARCHSGTVLAGGGIDLAGGKHIDGTLQVDGGGCTACHGTEGVNPAPPVGTNGETLTTQRAVGAHQKHVVTGTIRTAFTCSACHAPVSDLTHVNGTISLPFGGLASQGTTPSWTGTTCASTYCHGATLGAGGSTITPTWTAVSGGPTACSSCHGAPPPLPHPQNADCHRCHEGTVLATGAIDVAGGRHIDGTVQVSAGGCTACHGTDGVNPAPPLGTNGETLTTQRAVGAHQKHVVDGPIRRALACDGCHAPVADLTHVNGTISLPFTGLASQGTTPSFTGTACSSTYCHGATLDAGGAATTPVWTQVSAGVTGCTGCHGFPPPAPHPANPLCNSCHPLTVGIDGKIDVAGGRHVDGTLDVAGLTCRSCHGSTANPAPPIGTRGETATTDLAVGAHQRHVVNGPIRNALSCEECHVVPTELLHGNGTVDLAWGTLATQLGATPVWDRTQATCASTYCHGAKLAGGSVTTPTWTAVSPGQTSCGSCHGAPPPPPHPASALTGCARCHPDTVTPEGAIDLAGGHHIDGKLDVSGKCGDCHPVPGTSGAHLVHAAFPTPDGPQYGDLRVLEDFAPEGGPSYQFGCGNCHPVDASKHMDFVVQVELSPTGAGGLRARNAPGAAYDAASGRCSGVYCHSSGQQTPAFALVPGWTSGENLGCDGCHGNPPKYPSAGAAAPIANSHIGLTDRGREFGHYVGLGGPSHASKHGGAGEGAAPITCQTCHYATTDPASTGPSGFYWLDTTGTYVLDGGDPARLTDELWTRTQCVTCHRPNGAPTASGRVMPLRHVNGRPDVLFDPRTVLPSYAGLPPAPDAPTRPYWVSPAQFCEAVPAGAVIEGSTLSIELSGAAYDPATKRCSNVGCHLDDSPVWGRPYLTQPSSSSVASCCRCHGSRCSSP
ncbi:MAG TPA: CxxxxCH/CxxCH domain-containing protein, partial [Anaeromyxobacter sp.]|nr:CxxxxCH/CxxCH domain-containing protein [Anaeromyxobacter sp.]